MSARIIIGADLVPTESNYQYFKNGNVKNLIGNELQDKLNNADFTIFNLEVPLTDIAAPIDKCGPNLLAPVNTIEGLKAINPYFFTLANNHILDQGEQGLASTITTLDKAGIKYAGAGKNIKEARAPYVTEINGIKIGIYCCAEHEFTIATENRPGANPFDPLESPDHIISLKQNCDYVIVLYHGGKEHFRYPSPWLQKTCRKLVEKGADLVVCQHSHCIGAAEEWVYDTRVGKIIYGQGNFLFDNNKSEYWKTGLLIVLKLEKQLSEEKKDVLGENIIASFQYLPLQKLKETVRLAKGIDAQNILTTFECRSKEILSPEKVVKFYQQFADSMLNKYLIAFAGTSTRGFLYRAFNKLSGQRLNKWNIGRKYKRQERIVIRNFVECEAHRELMLQGLKMEN